MRTFSLIPLVHFNRMQCSMLCLSPMGSVGGSLGTADCAPNRGPFDTPVGTLIAPTSRASHATDVVPRPWLSGHCGRYSLLLQFPWLSGHCGPSCTVLRTPPNEVHISCQHVMQTVTHIRIMQRATLRDLVPNQYSWKSTLLNVVSSSSFHANMAIEHASQALTSHSRGHNSVAHEFLAIATHDYTSSMHVHFEFYSQLTITLHDQQLHPMFGNSTHMHINISL